MSQRTTSTGKIQEQFQPTSDEKDVLCVAIQEHPFIGASLVDSDGNFFWANARAKILYLGDSEASVAGKSLYDLFPKEWCDERVSLMHKLNETGQPGILRHIRRGRSLMVTYNQMVTPEGQAQRYLILIAEAEDNDQIPVPSNYHQFETSMIDLGPLDKLSRREIEVLALISRGMTTDEIAKDLSRSPKTIEAHRSSIARKLGMKNRVQLADIARKASLDIQHADMKRV
jgi:DNA-binding NarL/FixJ family response regulator